MKHVSLDIETTGRDLKKCQIIQVALVYDVIDGGRLLPVELLEHIDFLVENKSYNFPKDELGALEMNYNKLTNIHAGAITVKTEDILRKIHDFLFQFRIKSDSPLTIIGKNAAQFDWLFLEVYTGIASFYPNARFIDPTILFMNPLTDEKVIDTAELYKRAGLDCVPQHDALHDARCMVEIFRRGILKAGLTA